MQLVDIFTCEKIKIETTGGKRKETKHNQGLLYIVQSSTHTRALEANQTNRPPVRWMNQDCCRYRCSMSPVLHTWYSFFIFVMQSFFCTVDDVRGTPFSEGRGEQEATLLKSTTLGCRVGYSTDGKLVLTSVMVGTGSDPGCGVPDPSIANRLSAPVPSPVRLSPGSNT